MNWEDIMITANELESYKKNIGELYKFIQDLPTKDSSVYQNKFMHFSQDAKEFNQDFSVLFNGDKAALSMYLDEFVANNAYQKEVKQFIEILKKRVEKIATDACKKDDDIYKLCETILGQLEKFNKEVAASSNPARRPAT